jgi:hypothetical protein
LQNELNSTVTGTPLVTDITVDSNNGISYMVGIDSLFNAVVLVVTTGMGRGRERERERREGKRERKR